MSYTILIALALQSSASAEPLTARTEAVPTASLSIPTEVAPAVAPYVLCAIAAGGQPVISDGETMAEADAGRDCSEARAKAMTDGVRLLRQRGLGGNQVEREEYLEKVLADVDEFARPKSAEELLEIYNRRQSEKND